MMVNAIGAAEAKKNRVTCLRPLVCWGWVSGCGGFAIALGATSAGARAAWNRRLGTI